MEVPGQAREHKRANVGNELPLLIARPDIIPPIDFRLRLGIWEEIALA